MLVSSLILYFKSLKTGSFNGKGKDWLSRNANILTVSILKPQDVSNMSLIMILVANESLPSLYYFEFRELYNISGQHHKP